MSESAVLPVHTCIRIVQPSPHADKESVCHDLFVANQAVPLPPHTSILDQRWWHIAEARRQIFSATLKVHSAETQSYFECLGQSTREDYHRAFADTYGMAAIGSPEWTNSYTSFEALAYLLNRLEDRVKGQTAKQWVSKTIAFEPWTYEVWTAKPLDRCNAVLRALSVWTSAFGRPIGDVPRHRCRKDPKGTWVADVLMQVVKPRPSHVTQVLVETPLDPEWYNPVQVDLPESPGMLILADSMQRNFRVCGVEGLSCVIDNTERMHIVYWVTDHFPYKAIGRDGKLYTNQGRNRPAKRPLSVYSLPTGTDPADALDEMKRISQGMTRVCRDGEEADHLAWIAADLDANATSRSSVPEISGSHEWLALVADQRATGTTYRPRGATSDD